MAVTIEDVFIALSYPGMPETCIKDMPNGFMVVPFDTIIKKSHHKDYELWQYAFVIGVILSGLSSKTKNLN